MSRENVAPRDIAAPQEIVVAAFYKFTALPAFAAYRADLQMLCAQHGVAGTILLAEEGVNGTIAGPRAGVNAILTALRGLPGCGDLDHKESVTDKNPFYRAKVRLKKEIVTMGVAGVSPVKDVGEYVEPEDWNALIASDDVVVIDTRNDYEVAIGTFEGAVNPETKSFRDFPAWFENFHRDNPGKKIAMFCTGGIRCEKATAFAKAAGAENVFHLKGGILRYFEKTPQTDSLWKGECFVFDNRVSVNHALEPGAYEMCHACRRPLDADAMASPHYQKGVSCPHCIDEHSEARRRDFAERQKQIDLARQRGETHIGARRAPAKCADGRRTQTPREKPFGDSKRT